MPEKVTAGPLRGNPPPREAVCIHTRKVYDSCRDRDCMQDVRVYLTASSQAVLENAMSVKAQSAELLWSYVDVEPIGYNRGFYTVDVRSFYRVECDAFTGVGRPRRIAGLASCDKRTVLFGSEGSARIFSSDYVEDGEDLQYAERTNLPVAEVEMVDPVCLSARMVDPCCEVELNAMVADIPAHICSCFEEDLVIGSDVRQLLVSLGQFSIIRLERDVQLLIPAYDFCMPQNECPGNPDDPCALFQNFRFPTDAFFPPRASELNPTGCAAADQTNVGGCSCGSLSRRR